MSDKSTDANIKRWNHFIDENNGKVFYMSGRQNLIADDLYQQPLNNLEAKAQSDSHCLLGQ